MTDKLCIDCKWCDYKKPPFWKHLFSYVPGPEFAKCRHETSAADNDTYARAKMMVDGKDRREYNYCSIMRGGYASEKLCGPDAKFFEPKE